jgi:hypothetical protein
MKKKTPGLERGVFTFRRSAIFARGAYCFGLAACTSSFMLGDGLAIIMSVGSGGGAQRKRRTTSNENLISSALYCRQGKSL